MAAYVCGAADLLLVALIVGVVLFEALQSIELVLAKARVLNALSLARTEQVEANEALAVRGVLPQRATEAVPSVAWRKRRWRSRVSRCSRSRQRGNRPALRST